MTLDKNIFYFFSVVYIKEEPKDVTFDEMNSLLKKENYSYEVFNVEKQSESIGPNYSMDKFVMKEEPLQDDFVSKC